VNGSRTRLLLLPLLLLMLVPLSCRHGGDRPDLKARIVIDQLHLAADGPLYLSLEYHWDPGPGFRQPFTNPKVYVHLLNHERMIIAQDDHSPEPPVLSWQPDTPVSYQRVFLLPRVSPEIFSKPFRIRVGLYESKAPEEKILFEEFRLDLGSTRGEPLLVPLEGELAAVSEGWTRRRLAPRLPSADYRVAGASAASLVRLVDGEQVALARQGKGGVADPSPLAILTPGGYAVEFALTLLPQTRLVFSARSESEASLRVVLQKYGEKEVVLCEERFSGTTGRREFQLTTTARRPAWIRLEASSDEDVLWIEPSLETRIRQPAMTRRRLTTLRQLKKKARAWNVLLVVQDAARADELSCYGNPRRTTPALDRLSRQSILVTRATANAPYTLSSTASLFTGLYPTSHQVLGLEDRLPAHLPHLGEAFHRAGFITAAVSASPFTSSVYGMNRGFQYYLDNFKMHGLFTGPELVRTVGLLYPYLAQRDKERRYFLYTHFLEPHSPYEPPEPFRGWFAGPPGSADVDGSLETLKAMDRGQLECTPERVDQVEALYQGNLMYGDLQLAKLLASLRREGLLERTLIIVTSDHGEAFNEHGRMLHNSTVFQEMIHIPLVLSFPKDGPAPRRYHQPVETVDLTALLQDLFLPREWAGELAPEGTSFLPPLVGVPPAWKDLGLALGTHGESFSLTSGRFKLILEENGLHLYNLDLDPGERSALPWQGLLPEALTRQALLHQLVHRSPVVDGGEPAARSELPTSDELTREQLRALGYID